MQTVERRVAAAAMAVAALIHLVLIPEYFEEKAYIGVLFAVSVPPSLWLAAVLWRHHDARAWIGGAVLALGMAGAFVVSRTVGLPGFDESGEWEPLGLASLVVEVTFALVAGRALLPRQAVAA
jgi:hypothetical protein